MEQHFQKPILEPSFCDASAYEHHWITQSWKLRNNSRGVGNLLCPEYLVSNTLTSDMSPTRKITIPSRKCIKDSSVRKPMKDCYCSTEVNNFNKTKLNQVTSERRNNCIEIPLLSIDEHNTRNISTPPLSCETLRKFQKINYTPKSQFLRRIQSKVSILENGSGGDGSNDNITTACKRIISSNELPRYFENVHKYTSTSELLKKALIQDEDDDLIEIYSHPKPPPSVIKKTLTSNKSDNEMSKSILTKKKLENPLLDHGICCTRVKQRFDCKHCCNCKKQCSHCDVGTDDEMKDVRKFREQNYFDTHGSNHTLTSGSLGTVHQYLLNERLFPEFVGTIDKRDVVLTTPFCATKQNNRIHYFPRYIVPQVKLNKNTINGKNQCAHKCPLTGHTVDLGVLKTYPPSNSLALKYQKRTNWNQSKLH